MADLLTLPTTQGALVLRAEEPADSEFLYDLFRSHALTIPMPVDPSVQESLIRMQFRSQTATYRATYPNARFDIILHKDTPTGRLVVDDNPISACIVDFALTPNHRGQGLGSAIIAATLQRLGSASRPVRCSVLCTNQVSLRMFQRCGFAPVGEQGAHIQMEWHPPG